MRIVTCTELNKLGCDNPDCDEISRCCLPASQLPSGCSRDMGQLQQEKRCARDRVHEMPRTLRRHSGRR